MTLRYVLFQNLRRNRLRTGLTVVAFALPMAVFVGAISLVVALIAVGKENEQQLRIAVHSKTTLTNMLSEAGRRKIEGLDPERQRIVAVCGMRWFGGRVPDTQNTLTSLAADPDTFPIVYADAEMSEAEIANWNKDRIACAVGSGIADQYGWKMGDRVTLESTVPPYLKLEFRIVRIMTNDTKLGFFFFRRDYLEEELKKADAARQNQCNIFWVKCRDAAQIRALQPEIDALFANTPDETKSEDENAFAANFTQAAGNIPGLMQAMSIVVVFIVALVAGNTMMMSFRERTKELAVFKAIGFSRWRVFGMVLSESVVLAVLGAALGVVPMSALLVNPWLWLPKSVRTFGPIGALQLSPAAVAASLVIALAVGVAAGLWPAYQAMRLRTVDALRRVA